MRKRKKDSKFGFVLLALGGVGFGYVAAPEAIRDQVVGWLPGTGGPVSTTASAGTGASLDLPEPRQEVGVASTPPAPTAENVPEAEPISEAAREPESHGGAGGAGNANASVLLAQAQKAFESGDEVEGLSVLFRVARQWPEAEAGKTAMAESERRSMPALDYVAQAEADADLEGQLAGLTRMFFASHGLAGRDALRPQLDRVADQVFFSRHAAAGTTIHVVKAGDTLDGIGRKYSVPHGFIKRINGLRSNTIRLGQRLKIVTAKVEIIVIKRDFRLLVTVGGLYLKQYSIGTGKDDRTPEGEFVIDTRIPEPTWYGPDGVYEFGDPQNILGTRWLGFAATESHQGFGIHGTSFPESIGTESSMGCVRMRNQDVEELFDLIASGTRVVIMR